MYISSFSITITMFLHDRAQLVLSRWAVIHKQVYITANVTSWNPWHESANTQSVLQPIFVP